MSWFLCAAILGSMVGAGAVNANSSEQAIEHLMSLGAKVTSYPVDGGTYVNVIIDRKWKGGAEGLAQLAQVLDLDLLRVNDINLPDKAFSQIAGLANLQRLHFLDTAVSDADFMRLGELPKLHTLKIRKAKITNSALASMKRYPGLESLDLTNCDGVDDAGLRSSVNVIALKFPLLASKSGPHWQPGTSATRGDVWAKAGGEASG